MKTNEEKQEFYDRVAIILNIEHEFHEPVRRRNRWNTRKIGNGRFSGFGLVQCYGSFVRVVSKRGTKTFNTYEDTYKYLEEIMACW